MISYNELSLTTGGNRVRIADLTLITFEAVCTEGIRGKIKRLQWTPMGMSWLTTARTGREKSSQHQVAGEIAVQGDGSKMAGSRHIEGTGTSYSTSQERPGA